MEVGCGLNGKGKVLVEWARSEEVKGTRLRYRCLDAWYGSRRHSDVLSIVTLAEASGEGKGRVRTTTCAARKGRSSHAIEATLNSITIMIVICIYNKIQKPGSYPGKEKASTCKGTLFSRKLTPGAFFTFVPTYFLPISSLGKYDNEERLITT